MHLIFNYKLIKIDIKLNYLTYLILFIHNYNLIIFGPIYYKSNESHTLKIINQKKYTYV